MGAHFNEEETIAKPVLGLNLKDYFDKRHLVDQPPVEPLPPIENPLEMTQRNDKTSMMSYVITSCVMKSYFMTLYFMTFYDA